MQPTSPPLSLPLPLSPSSPLPPTLTLCPGTEERSREDGVRRRPATSQEETSYQKPNQLKAPILEFQPPEPCEIYFCGFSRPVCGVLLRLPKRRRTQTQENREKEAPHSGCSPARVPHRVTRTPQSSCPTPTPTPAPKSLPSLETSRDPIPIPQRPGLRPAPVSSGDHLFLKN